MDQVKLIPVYHRSIVTAWGMCMLFTYSSRGRLVP